MGIVSSFCSSELKFLGKYYSSSNKLPLTDYTPVSRKVVEWKCSKCKHVELKSIKYQTEWFRKFKYKSHKLSSIEAFCVNCIRIKFPYLPKNASDKRLRMFSVAFDRHGSFKKHGKKHLLKEWDHEKNIVGPDRYGRSSRYKVWWKCKYGHSYQKSIKERSEKNPKCRKCHYYCSKEEARLFAELKLIDPKVKLLERIDGFECDIFLKSSKIAIEVDGYPWHVGEKKIAKDKKKTKYLKSIGITLLRFRERRCGRIHSTDTIYDDSYVNSIFKPYTRLIRKIKRLSKSEAVKKRVDKYLSKNKSFVNNDLYYDIYHNSSTYGGIKQPADKIHKELSKQWGDKNILPMSHYARTSSKHAWWKCNKCNDEYREEVEHVTTSWIDRYKRGGLKAANKNNSCPIHKPKAKVNKFNNIVEVYGKWILDVWDYKKNFKSPYEFKARTSGVKNLRKVWFKCHVCNSSHSRQLYTVALTHKVYGRKDSVVVECTKCKEKYHTKKSLNVPRKKVENLIVKRIKEIVASECKSSPLPDLEIGKILYKEGLLSLNTLYFTNEASNFSLANQACKYRNVAGIPISSKRKELSVYDVYGERILEIWDNKKNKQSVYDFSYTGSRNRKVWLKCPNGCSTSTWSIHLFHILNNKGKVKNQRGVLCKKCGDHFNAAKRYKILEKNIINIINNEFKPLSDSKIATILVKKGVLSPNLVGPVKAMHVKKIRDYMDIMNYYDRRILFNKGEKIEYEYVQ